MLGTLGQLVFVRFWEAGRDVKCDHNRRMLIVKMLPVRVFSRSDSAERYRLSSRPPVLWPSGKSVPVPRDAINTAHTPAMKTDRRFAIAAAKAETEIAGKMAIIWVASSI